MKNLFVGLVIVCFVATSFAVPVSVAGEIVVPPMPNPGSKVQLSPGFIPSHLKGLTIHPDNALEFDFLIHKGDGNLDPEQKKTEYNKLVKYFLASLTIADKDQWVNLSPYEKGRIIDDNFGKTEMGRDLLAQDYLLKQITSSLMYPESGFGKSFWDKVYQRAYQEYGTTSIPVTTFNKVWIVPDEAIVYESGNTAYILKSHLNVMLEEDYLSLQRNAVNPTMGTDQMETRDVAKVSNVTSKIVREVILPEIEKEVNEGKNFSQLRQIFSGMILATWYKKALRASLLGQVYADKSKTSGVNQPDPKTNEEIYQKYLAAFKKGVYNYIKDDFDQYSKQTIPRKYFAGGYHPFDRAMKVKVEGRDKAQAVVTIIDPTTVGFLEPAEIFDIQRTAPSIDAMDYAAIALTTDSDAARTADAAMIEETKLRNHVATLIQQSDLTEFHRTLKLIVAARDNNPGILRQPGQMPANQITNTLGRLNGIPLNNMDTIVQAAGRAQDYDPIIRTLKNLAATDAEVVSTNGNNNLGVEDLRAHLTNIQTDAAKFHRTLKLLAASINDDPQILRQSGPMPDEKIKDTLGRLGEFSFANTEALIQSAGRGADYNPIHQALRELATKRSPPERKIPTDRPGIKIPGSLAQEKVRGLQRLDAQIRQNRLPEVINFGDKHGKAEDLERILINARQAAKEGRSLKIIGHGDAFDRGPSNVRVFEIFQELKRIEASNPNISVRFLWGNHDVWVAQAILLNDNEAASQWRAQGGRELVDQFKRAGLNVRELALFMVKNFELTHVDEFGFLHVHAGIPMDDNGNPRFSRQEVNVLSNEWKQIQESALKDPEFIHQQQNQAKMAQFFKKASPLFWVRSNAWIGKVVNNRAEDRLRIDAPNKEKLFGLLNQLISLQVQQQGITIEPSEIRQQIEQNWADMLLGNEAVFKQAGVNFEILDRKPQVNKAKLDNFLAQLEVNGIVVGHDHHNHLLNIDNRIFGIDVDDDDAGHLKLTGDGIEFDALARSSNDVQLDRQGLISHVDEQIKRLGGEVVERVATPSTSPKQTMSKEVMYSKSQMEELSQGINVVWGNGTFEFKLRGSTTQIGASRIWDIKVAGRDIQAVLLRKPNGGFSQGDSLLIEEGDELAIGRDQVTKEYIFAVLGTTFTPARTKEGVIVLVEREKGLDDNFVLSRAVKNSSDKITVRTNEQVASETIIKPFIMVSSNQEAIDVLKRIYQHIAYSGATDRAAASPLWQEFSQVLMVGVNSGSYVQARQKIAQFRERAITDTTIKSTDIDLLEETLDYHQIRMDYREGKYHQALGVDQNASPQVIKDAHDRLAARYVPEDRPDEADRQRITDLSNWIKQAYEKLQPSKAMTAAELRNRLQEYDFISADMKKTTFNSRIKRLEEIENLPNPENYQIERMRASTEVIQAIIGEMIEAVIYLPPLKKEKVYAQYTALIKDLRLPAYSRYMRVDEQMRILMEKPYSLSRDQVKASGLNLEGALKEVDVNGRHFELGKNYTIPMPGGQNVQGEVVQINQANYAVAAGKAEKAFFVVTVLGKAEPNLYHRFSMTQTGSDARPLANNEQVDLPPQQNVSLSSPVINMEISPVRNEDGLEYQAILVQPKAPYNGKGLSPSTVHTLRPGSKFMIDQMGVFSLPTENTSAYLTMAVDTHGQLSIKSMGSGIGIRYTTYTPLKEGLSHFTKEGLLEEIMGHVRRSNVRDLAALSAVSSKRQTSTGGIDLNAANMKNFQIKRDGRGVPLPLSKQDMSQLRQIRGFVPIILEIRPATMSALPVLSELQDHFQNSAATLASAS